MTPTRALEKLIATVEATGGLDEHKAPVADPDWSDMGDVYLAACASLGRIPMVKKPEPPPSPVAHHTPGPWSHSATPFASQRIRQTFYGIGNGVVHIGYVSVTGCVSESEALANARLIAAAPALLKAAMGVIENWEHTLTNPVAELRAAIEQALGQTFEG